MKDRLKHFLLALLSVALVQQGWSQGCIPAAPATVAGTVTAASGTVTFTNVPTGNVIQVNCPVANTSYEIDLCGTNAGTVPSGTNDGVITIIDANTATAVELDMFDDGCTNVTAPGYGPPVGTYVFPSAGTFFIYLTEWNQAGNDNCVDDGVNSNYNFEITITPPPANDIAIDSAYAPLGYYTSVPMQQVTGGGLSVGARVRNLGSATVTNVSVAVRIRSLVSGLTVGTQTITGPASFASGATANLTGTTYNPPMVSGAYEFRYIVSMTQLDGDRTNDTAFRYIQVDTSLMAVDEAIFTGGIDNVLGSNQGPILMGQDFVFNVATGIDTVFGYFIFDASKIGDTVDCVIYNTNANGTPTTQVAASALHIITAADTGGALIPLVFNPIQSVGVGTYFVGMRQYGPRNFGLAQNEGGYALRRAYFSVAPFTTFNAVELAGFPGYFIIWVNTRCALTASATGTNTTCGLSNGGATLTVTGASGTPTYAWSNSTTAANLTNVAAGSYTVTVTDGGCNATAAVTLTNTGTQPVITLTPSSAQCGSTNGSVTSSVAGSGGPYTYTWSNAAGNVTSINNVASGSYSVTVTDGTCSATATTFVGSTGGPTASATGTNVNCNGGSTGSATGSATGGTTPYTYTWSNGGSTATINGLAAGTYTVTIADASSCLATATYVVTEPTALTASVTTTNVNCFNGTDGEVAATSTGGTGNATYNWSNSSTTATISNLAAGTYTVTVTDANSCTATASATLANPTQVTASTTVTNVGCNGGNNGGVALTAAGGTGTFTYSWSNSTTLANLTNVVAGTYTVTVTDGNSCTATATASVTEPTAITASATCTETVQGQSTGTATVTANGGTGAYSYNWSSGASTATASGLGAGVVNVTVTDANNCTVTANCEVQFSVGINETNAGITSLNVFPNPSNGQFNLQMNLNTASNVEIAVLDVRGAVVYTEKLNSVSNVTKTINLTELAGGIYSLRITTANGVVSKKISIN